MKRTLRASLICFWLLLPLSFAGAADPLPASPAPPPQAVSSDAGTGAQGVKELLTVAADRAVKAVAKTDGFAGNKAIRIGIPDEMEHLPTYIGKYGFQPQIDAFILSLNRAAEKGATKAAPLLAEAIRESAFDAPGKILNGGDTAATDYFREKNSEKLYNALKPAIIAGMNEVGVLPAYREMLAKYDEESVLVFPVDKWDFDMEGYVTGKTLDGLFSTMGGEEKRIRKEPAARTTELLRQVFGAPQ
jgi:hypothetical protein